MFKTPLHMRFWSYRFWSYIVWGFLQVPAIALSQTHVGLLDQGEWHKIAASGQGVYALTPESLSAAGVDVSVWDPNTVQLYGSNGAPLSQAVADAQTAPLHPVATYFQGNDNNTWEPNERLLFYVPRAGLSTYDPQTNQYDYQVHPYTDTLYYYLTHGAGEALHLGSAESESLNQTLGQSPIQVRSYDAVYYYKKEETNMLTSGRTWYGEELFVPNTLARSFELPLAPPVGTEVRLRSMVMGSCLQQACAVDVTLQGQSVIRHEINERPTGNYAIVGYDNVQEIVHTATSAPWELRYAIQGTPGSLARLHHFLVQATMPLRYLGVPLFFRNSLSATHTEDVLEYRIDIDNGGESDGLMLWRITDPLVPVRLNYELQGTELVFRTTHTQLDDYVLFDPGANAVRLAEYKNRVAAPQIEGSVPMMLVISAPELLSQARRLASFREANDGLRVRVVSTSAVYDAFGAGVADPTALRNCIYYFYAQSPDLLQYVLLFGGASYDLKGLLVDKVAYVPTYQSIESLDPTATFSSDDYYGFMELHEGLWSERPAVEHTLELGIGRIPARTIAQAKIAVDKLMTYVRAPHGNWRQQLYFVADDGDRNLHNRNTEELVVYLDQNYPQYQPRRIYLDDFVQVREGGRQTSPACQERLLRAINAGALCVNFNGHGNQSVWMAEEIFNPSSVDALENISKLPLFVTATCEFGRHDVPDLPSEGERLLFHPSGGGIALMTASRPVFASANYRLDSAFSRAVLRPLPNNRMPRLGDVMRMTKNPAPRGNRSFILLGDPSLQLAYPELEATITHLNGQPIQDSENAYSVGAFALTTLDGIVQDPDGNPVDYSGQALIHVYDKTVPFETLGDENPPFEYEKRSSLLFLGNSSVVNGQFSVRFVVPRSISYRQGTGRVLIYLNPTVGVDLSDTAPGLGAADKQSSIDKPDGSGAWDALSIGGAPAESIQDIDGPQIRAYIGDPSFIPGDQVAPSVVLYMDLEDKTGIRLNTNGVIVPLSARLKGTDRDELHSLVDYYEANLDSYQQGQVRYAFPLLPEGRYTLDIEVWDNYDNISYKTLDFVVSLHTPVRLWNVINFPNPFDRQTTFAFEHDKGDNLLDIELYVWDAQGGQVDTRSWRVGGNQGKVNNLLWQVPRRTLPHGLYVYMLRVVAQHDQTQGVAHGRMIIRY